MRHERLSDAPLSNLFKGSFETSLPQPLKLAPRSWLLTQPSANERYERVRRRDFESTDRSGRNAALRGVRYFCADVDYDVGDVLSSDGEMVPVPLRLYYVSQKEGAARVVWPLCDSVNSVLKCMRSVLCSCRGAIAHVTRDV